MEVLNFKKVKESITEDDKLIMCEEIKKRQMHKHNLKEFGAAVLNNAFAVVYGSTADIDLFDGQSLDAKQRIKLIYCLIDQIQIGSNLEREIIGQSGNVYFVY